MKEQHHHHIQEIVITDDVGKLWYSFLHLELMHYELHIWIIEEKKKTHTDIFSDDITLPQLHISLPRI